MQHFQLNRKNGKLRQELKKRATLYFCPAHKKRYVVSNQYCWIPKTKLTLRTTKITYTVINMYCGIPLAGKQEVKQSITNQK